MVDGLAQAVLEGLIAPADLLVVDVDGALDAVPGANGRVIDCETLAKVVSPTDGSIPAARSRSVSVPAIGMSLIGSLSCRSVPRNLVDRNGPDISSSASYSA